jgi:hypothetical protein
VVKSLEEQIVKDVAPIWGVSANLTFLSKESKIPSDTWVLYILKETDTVGALGYHELGDNGLPIAKVFAASAKQAGSSWTVTASHEIINMLINPRANLSVFVDVDAKSKLAGHLYAYEPASPCESEKDGYLVNGTLVSDFVYPDWFEPSAKKADTKLDKTGRALKPLEVCAGGYVLVYDITGGAWRPVFKEK